MHVSESPMRGATSPVSCGIFHDRSECTPSCTPSCTHSDSPRPRHNHITPAKSPLPSSALAFPICVFHSHNTPISGNSIEPTGYRSSSPSFPSVWSLSSSPPSAPPAPILLTQQSTSIISTVSRTSLPEPEPEAFAPRPAGLLSRLRRIRSSSPKTLAQREERQSTALRLALKRSEASERLFARREDGWIILPPLPKVARTQADETSRTDSAHVPFFRLPDLRLPLDEDGTQNHSKKVLIPPIYGPVRPPLPILQPIYKPPPTVSNSRSTGEPHSPGFLSSFSQVSISGPSSPTLRDRKLNRRKVLKARSSTKSSDASTPAVKATLAVPVPQGFVRGWKTARIHHPDDPLSRLSTAPGSGTGNGSTTATPPPKRRTRPRSWAHPVKPTLNMDRWGNTGDSNVDSSLDVREGRRSGMGPNDTFFLAWKSADGTAFKETVRGRGRR